MAILNLQELELLCAHLLTDARRPTTGELAGRWIPLVLRLLALAVALRFPAVGLWALLLTVAWATAQWLIRRRAER